MVEFRVLGDVQARDDGRLLDLGHARQRCVLATLLADANQVVSPSELVDRIWGGIPPTRARDVLYSYLSRLRSPLARVDDASLQRRGGGYVLSIEPNSVDMHRFRDLVRRGRQTDCSNSALGLFEQALALWRGDAFTALDTEWLDALRDTLAWERFVVELDCYDLRLDRGQHARILPALTARAEAQPLDERVTGQLMLALYRCGRQVDSLDRYARLRTRLVEELGIEPGRSLQRLHEQILAHDAAVKAP